jgi:NADP-dependent aldehyde dehydrogenase
MNDVGALQGVELAAKAEGEGAHGGTAAPAALFVTDAAAWFNNPRLAEEIYGPATVALRCGSPDDFLRIARSLKGHLTATLHATDKDLATHAELVAVLRHKAGRLVVNGFPTGVEVCPSMHHGGPYPATTDSRSTSVGTAAIDRFARPVCFQGFPQSALPPELQDDNPRRIWRTVDGELTK